MTPAEPRFLSNQLIASLASKEGRLEFLGTHLSTSLPLQIQALRKARGWSLSELARRMGTSRQCLSQFMSLTEAKRKIGLHTLLRAAFALDVALMVKFCSFSELTEWDLRLNPESFEVTSFEGDIDLLHNIENAQVRLSLDS